MVLDAPVSLPGWREARSELSHVFEPRLHLLQVTLDCVPARVSSWDHERLNVFANQAFLEWFGLTRAATTGRHARDVMGGLWLAQIEDAITEGLAGQTRRLETLFLADDGAHQQCAARSSERRPGADGLLHGVQSGRFSNSFDVSACRCEPIHQIAAHQQRLAGNFGE